MNRREILNELAQIVAMTDTVGLQRPTSYGVAEAARRVSAAHITRHDPARVLRDVEAKRAIVALHKTDIDPADALYGSNARCEECGTYVVLTGPCKALRILAAIWVDHPDYDQEWKP